jgi:hypothetical protein
MMKGPQCRSGFPRKILCVFHPLGEPKEEKPAKKSYGLGIAKKKPAHQIHGG